MQELMEREVVDRKVISITGKRQITIPLKFYDKLSFEKEVECIATENALIIRPLKSDNGEFSVEILKDLVAKGYTGDELVDKFKEQSKNIKYAVDVLIKQAEEIAEGSRKGATVKDIFGKDF
jgi:bifunctional DNA-binding transcriptional regulator/antitoxin component of YhaV-PrlF toxin-antitoxin module